MRRYVLALSIVSLGIIPFVASAEERHSGHVVSVDPAAGTIVLDELTASRGQMPASMKRTVAIAPGGQVQVLSRSDNARESTWPGGFTASAVSLADIRRGDFVTVVGQERSGRLEATSVDLVRGESQPSASPR
jgi:hypothetical protein